MNTIRTLFRRLLTFAGAVAFSAALAFGPAPATAASYEGIQTERALGNVVTRHTVTDGVVALRLKWIGTGVASTVDVSSAGDLVFTTDGTTADTTLGLPTSNGTIDVSDSSANTWGKVIDEINASGNWVAILVDALPSDSSDNVLTDFAETTATGIPSVSTHGIFDEEGAELTVNIADVDMLTASIGPEYAFDDWLQVQGDNLLNRRSTPVPNSGEPTRRNELTYLTGQMTCTTTIPDLQIYAVSSDAAGATELLLLRQVGVTSATTAQTFDLRTAALPLRAPRGWRLVARIKQTATGDCTAGYIQVHGLSWEE